MFEVGNRVMNNGNRDRKVIGIITKVINVNFAEVLWSNGVSAWTGTIKRDGTTPYGVDRIVRVDLSVRIRQEV